MRELEFATVLFMDIVGYSRVPDPGQQGAMVRSLQDAVRASSEFQRAEARGDLLRLPTGDGLALVFFADPVAPVRCAMQVAEALAARPQLQLRTGIHHGPVYRIEDINANTNVSGGGINLAQRVMDCGEAGHILLSSTVVELISQIGAWPIHDLGRFEVKHNVSLHLFNLYTDGIGNPQVPGRLLSRLESRPDVRAEPFGARPPKVVLLYKRHAEPDESLLKVLEDRLREDGCEVFIDRHLSVGVEWAAEIERRIRTADAVIPLISSSGVHSEMLQQEIETARDAQAERRGRPVLLPVRINHTGALPPALAAILDPLEYALWVGPQDTDTLVGDLLTAIRNPPGPAAARARLEATGGAVPLDSEYYVVRPSDAEFQAAMSRRDSIVLLKGARQMGKTSLLARGLQRARQAGSRVVLTDFQKLSAEHLQSADSLFTCLAEWLADQLDLDVLPDEVWNARRGPSVNFERYVRREALGKTDAHIVWGMDEVDRLFAVPYASEVFGLFRSWHNERALDPDGPWSRLTLAIAYATEAHLFITDINQSPFNVGTRIALEDFTLDEVADLNLRHGSPLRTHAELARYFRLVGGHPYLIRRGLHEMVQRGMEVAAFEAQADREDGVFGDHLRRVLVLLARDEHLMQVVRGVLQGLPCPDAESFYRLRSSGLLTGSSARDCRMRCQVYGSYLHRHL